jgi:hypothetical protein
MLMVGKCIPQSSEDAKLESGNHFGAPLHVAVLMENEEMVNLLLNHNLKDADSECE